jgi:hypothetical protein
MAVYKAGQAAAGKGPSSVAKAMKDKYMEQRGGAVTDRPGYDYATGGSAVADEQYLGRKRRK